MGAAGIKGWGDRSVALSRWMMTNVALSRSGSMRRFIGTYIATPGLGSTTTDQKRFYKFVRLVNQQTDVWLTGKESDTVDGDAIEVRELKTLLRKLALVIGGF